MTAEAFVECAFPGCARFSPTPEADGWTSLPFYLDRLVCPVHDLVPWRGPSQNDPFPECDGKCVYVSDLGLPYNGLAHADPSCAVHGEHGDY